MIEAGMTTEVIAYARQTRQRIGRLMDDLEELHHGDPGKVAALLDQLGQLARHSGELGFDGISNIVRDMSHCLNDARASERPLSPGTIAVLIDACHVISLHAEAVAVGLTFPANEKKCPHRDCHPSVPEWEPA